MITKTSPAWALILIAVALAGAGTSYHFTLDSRFKLVESKLDQTTIALQQFQVAQETQASARTEALNTLTKQVEALQTSLMPLGKATHDQTDSLSDVRKQIAALQAAAQAQQDAQKKLTDYGAQIAKLQHDIQAQASAAVPLITQPAAVTPAAATSAPAPKASPSAALSVNPRVNSVVDLRPAPTPGRAPVDEEEDVAAHTFPVALPVNVSTASR